MTTDRTPGARLEAALRPFNAAVFNDNGDVTISTGHITRGDWLALIKAMSAAPDVRVVTVAQLERWIAYAEDGIVSAPIAEIRAVIGETKK